MILICYIFSMNKVLEIRLVVLIPLTTIPKFNWQLCLNLTDPNFAWFNSHSTKKVPTLGLASSYLRTSILSVFYVCNLLFNQVITFMLNTLLSRYEIVTSVIKLLTLLLYYQLSQPQPLYSFVTHGRSIVYMRVKGLVMEKLTFLRKLYKVYLFL